MCSDQSPEKLRVWAGIQNTHTVYTVSSLGLMYIQAAIEKQANTVQRLSIGSTLITQSSEAA